MSTWADVKEVGGKLTKETFGALIHTTDALLEISEYCLQVLGAKYVLLGKFQTDSLESRFGQYRQLAGGKYDVSPRQVYECEKKLRLLSVLQLKLNNVDISLSDFSMDWNQYETTTSSNCFPIPVDIHQQDIEAFSNNIPVITYIGGYCCYSINKKLKCQECKELLVSNNGNENSFNHSLIKGLDRGKLLYPSDDIVRVALISNIVIHKLTSFDEFVKSFSQRALCINSILAALEQWFPTAGPRTAAGPHKFFAGPRSILFSAKIILIWNHKHCKDVTLCKTHFTPGRFAAVKLTYLAFYC